MPQIALLTNRMHLYLHNSYINLTLLLLITIIIINKYDWDGRVN